ncbi:MAG: DsbA family protein, partial [archaeon]|nr:DsbA family protein [archaeon]
KGFSELVLEMTRLKEVKKGQEKKDSGDNTLYTVLGVLLIVGGIAVVFMFLSNPGPGFDESELEAGGHIKGNEGASVTIVEFSDFQCPACGSAYEAFKPVWPEYESRVKFVYRHFPLSSIHPYAFKAAEASECAAEQGKFWEMHDTLFENQQNLKTEDLKSYAGKIGLEAGSFNSCLDSGKYTSKVAGDYSYATSIGLRGTPTFFVNGQQYSNMSADQWRSLLNSKLA